MGLSARPGPLPVQLDTAECGRPRGNRGMDRIARERDSRVGYCSCMVIARQPHQSSCDGELQADQNTASLSGNPHHLHPIHIDDANPGDALDQESSTPSIDSWTTYGNEPRLISAFHLIVGSLRPAAPLPAITFLRAADLHRYGSLFLVWDQS
jgi:hypothetical protein